ncbi:hypothetical protein UFOVP71_107 [uncultured Caudovirales phage]|uniref:Uncharacterized protein n=1 Tax=uncultured Caudovirales phage TaxID=2100421 RepID=A0A6J5TBC7_9CAUD|nr:hypothetical protein UFOVP71_107 [uncultured Caudovirales phage]
MIERHEKEVFYRKVGSRYKPVSEYDHNLLDAFPKGNHLVMCYPGGSSRRFNIEPALAPMIAAGRYAEDAISKAVQQASEMRPHNKPITEKQKKAWENLAKAFDTERYYIELPSAREVTEAGVNAMAAEAEKLMEHPMVQDAYNEFLATCKLVLDQHK